MSTFTSAETEIVFFEEPIVTSSQSILKDNTRHSNGLFTLLPSGERYSSIRFLTI